MRRRSPSLSPRRGREGREYRSPSCSPRRGREGREYGGRGRRSPSVSRGRRYGRRGDIGDPPTSLLVRNIPRDSRRSEDLRLAFERYGVVKDVYLPKDYYTGEPRGFGFVQYRDPGDAAEAQYQMDHQVINGREITVVFAEENRKRPQEMRSRERTERTRGRTGYGGSGRRRSPYYVRSRSRSPRYSRSPRAGRSTKHSRSYSPPPKAHDRSYATTSPASHRRGRDSRMNDQAYSLTPEYKVLPSPPHSRDALNEPSGSAPPQYSMHSH